MDTVILHRTDSDHAKPLESALTQSF